MTAVHLLPHNRVDWGSYRVLWFVTERKDTSDILIQVGIIALWGAVQCEFSKEDWLCGSQSSELVT